MTTKQPSLIIVIASGTKWSAATPNLKIVFVLWGCFVILPRNDVRVCTLGLLRRRASSSQGRFI